MRGVLLTVEEEGQEIQSAGVKNNSFKSAQILLQGSSEEKQLTENEIVIPSR